jgi:hypothetical protein
MSSTIISKICERYHRIYPYLDERAKRMWVANEAWSIGRGGINAVHQATGVNRKTIRLAIKQHDFHAKWNYTIKKIKMDTLFAHNPKDPAVVPAVRAGAAAMAIAPTAKLTLAADQISELDSFPNQASRALIIPSPSTMAK